MADFLPSRPLPPAKAAALRLISKGALSGAWNGAWGPYNTHTVSWIVSVGWAKFNAERTQCTITRAGRDFLAFMEAATHG